MGDLEPRRSTEGAARADESVLGSAGPTPDSVDPVDATGTRPLSLPTSGGVLLSAGSALAGWFSRPRIRLALIGALLVLIGTEISGDSVWTLPILIIGVVMLVVAWVGHRLGGHISVDWGEHGAELSVAMRVQPSQAARPRAIAPAVRSVELPEPQTGATIEGEAHTVEIDADELQALIAAAEAAESPSVVRALRSARSARSHR